MSQLFRKVCYLVHVNNRIGGKEVKVEKLLQKIFTINFRIIIIKIIILLL